MLRCVLDQNNIIVVTENKRAPQKCGKLSQHTKLFSQHNGKPCCPRTAWADVGTSAAQTALLCFDFITARPHSDQTSPSNQMVIDGLAASLAFAVVYTFPHPRLHKEIISVILLSPIPPFNHPSSTTSVFPLISCSFCQAQLIWCTPVDSHLPLTPQSKC